ncbi:MAG: DUF6524 family protein [Gammaproteobacteria bacterium]|jgi:hypothetical protein|nr:DUF6524 family protein [Gammaproteobacteria bacterium]
MARTKFSWGNFFLRLLAAMGVVLVTYNPTAFNYLSWIQLTWPQIDPFKVIAGILLVIGWAICIRATIHSLGLVGTILAAALFGALIWLVLYMKLVPADSIEAIVWLILVAVGGVLGVGLSWSHVRRRITGQLDVDDSDT